jgi:hypothetical protein
MVKQDLSKLLTPERLKKSGMSLKEFAAANNVNLSTVQYFLYKKTKRAQEKKANGKTSGNGFHLVGEPVMIELCHPSGIKVRVPESAPVETFTKAIEALNATANN